MAPHSVNKSLDAPESAAMTKKLVDEKSIQQSNTEPQEYPSDEQGNHNDVPDSEQLKTVTDPVSKQENIETLLKNAKNAMKNEKYDEAVDNYADALELLNENDVDQFRLQLAPIYYSYGICLLNNSMKQNLLLGEKVPEVVPINQTHQENDSESQVQLQESDAIIDIDQPYAPTSEEIKAEAELEKELDSYDDLQLAWEVLDMARIIYSKQPSDKTNDLHLADVHIVLGDVGVESELFDTAVADYKSALSLKSQWLDKDDRTLAELHYKIACAYELGSNYPSAIEHVNHCLNMLRGRGQWIEKQISIQENDVEKQKMSEELDDLNTLYPDLEVKIDDLKSLQESTEEKVSLQTDQGSSSNITDGSKVALDVSGLIRKKPAKKRGSSTSIDLNEHCNPSIDVDNTNAKKSKTGER